MVLWTVEEKEKTLMNYIDNKKQDIKNGRIKSITIGNIKLKNNIIIAPMAGVTDIPFRYILNKMNPGLTFTEMVSSKGLLYDDEKTKRLMDILPDEVYGAVQIFGHDENDIREAIERINDIENIHIIDINMGCPARKVTKNGDGAELLKDLDLIERIIKVACSTSKKIITVKTRAGYDDSKITAVDVAKICEKYGVKMITIHGRTKKQMFKGKVDLDIIKKVKESVKDIIVIGNGDIVDYRSANHMLEYSGVDGIMIARGLMGNPWLIQEILEGRKIDVPKEEKLNTILEHIDKAVEYDTEKVAVPKMRKHIAWYLKGMHGSADVKNMINREISSEKVKEIIIDYFNNLD